MTHTYVTQNGKVMRETIGSGTTAKVLDFIYDNTGKPFALRYSTNGGSSYATYYYVLNLQGDVVKLVRIYAGTTIQEYEEMASYTYNAWGEIISSSGSMADINPLRYRGYYYDTETGFYYLQSRYYDPANHRFINADGYASTGTGFLGYNMFAYCNNNPANGIDPTGKVVSMIEFGNEALLYEGSTPPKAIIRFPPPSLGLSELFEPLWKFFIGLFVSSENEHEDSTREGIEETTQTDEPAFYGNNYHYGVKIEFGRGQAHTIDGTSRTYGQDLGAAISEDITGWGQLPIFYKVDD